MTSTDALGNAVALGDPSSGVLTQIQIAKLLNIGP